ncbi:response regulator [Gemmobacter fulvus]|uniref:Response regulator n=1 Tax=Gemmobacter fulvus TaxID=2840474 RepID=A0A975S0L5_9RHOB|nr:response regulator [Gemmobacter fulvus]MBT9245430.1 response regulator [Gemmobacter fulvus]QWK90259.1 response regulator [Gemmobacter fulvus]
MARHAMLIEDEPNIAEAIRFLLHRDGWQVSVLGEGGSAEARVREARPDLVILDLMLPGRSGLEILQGLRADPLTQGLPVMMLTAKGQGRDRAAAEQAGADLFMAKPFSNAEFVAAARSLIPV